MKYLAIYNKLQRMGELTQLNRLRMTFRIGRTLPIIRSAIMDYLDSRDEDHYVYPEDIRVTVMQDEGGDKVPVEYSCEAIQKKFMLPTPLSTLLYMDCLLKNPEAAILYSRQLDMVALPSREKIERHIDPRILELAKKKEREMIQSFESNLEMEIEDEQASVPGADANVRSEDEIDW